MSGPLTGRHLGRKLADIMHDARVTAGSKLIQAETDHRAVYHRAFMESVESDLAPTWRRIVGDVLEDPDLPDAARAFFEPLADPQHQGQFFLTIVALLGLGIAGPGAAAEGWLQRLRVQSLKAHGDVPLTPQEAAEGVLKGQVDHGYGQEQARAGGMHGDTFDALIALAGDPPGPAQLQEALRRGIIDQGRFEHGIRQSRIRNEWIDVMDRLRYAPVSAGLAIAAAVQNHLSIPDARQHVSQAGVDPVNFDWLYETHGRPPGTEEMLHLFRRGKVDQATVEQAIRESDVKNKYIPAIVNLREVVPPQRTVVSGVRQGAVDDGQARTWLNELGYPAAAVDMLLKEAHSTKATSVKDLSAAETVALFTEGIIDHGRAHDMLRALRFADDVADELLNLAVVKREHAAITASVRRVHSAYVGHRIDASTASTRLDALRLDTATRDQAMHLWGEERLANVRPLTESQVKALRKANLIDDEGFVQRHLAMGYTTDDARLLLALDFPPTQGA